MNLLININRKFLNPAAVMLYSFFFNNPGEHNVYVMNVDLEESDIRYLQEKSHSGVCKFINLNMQKVVNDYITFDRKGRWPITVYFRLFAPFVITNVDKILYLDSDMVIKGDLSTLYNLNMKDKLIAACEDTFLNDFGCGLKDEFDENYVYINSGLILFNSKAIRERYSVNDLINLIVSNENRFFFPDQDILNLMYKNEINYLNFRYYNYICSNGRYNKKQMRYFSKSALIFHFGGEYYYKPWNIRYIGKYRKVFSKYAIKSSYSEKKYIFILSKIFFPINYCFINIGIFISKIKRKISSR